MAGIKQSGFTIIELMLFLGVTGMLFAALMIGVNMNIAQQRYRESVVDYSSLLQQQYSEVSNTRNDRDDTWKCVNGRVSQDPNAGDARGTSSCVILGRAIQVKNGTTIETSDVIGTEPANLEATSDIETLVAYRPALSQLNTGTSEMNWGSVMVTPDHLPSSASFLILRSPSSGLIRVFASSEPLPSDLSSRVTVAAATTTIRNCVRGESGSLPTQSVSLDAKISSASGISVNEADMAC